MHRLHHVGAGKQPFSSERGDPPARLRTNAENLAKLRALKEACFYGRYLEDEPLRQLQKIRQSRIPIPRCFPHVGHVPYALALYRVLATAVATQHVSRFWRPVADMHHVGTHEYADGSGKTADVCCMRGSKENRSKLIVATY